MEKKRAGKKLANGFFINSSLLFDSYFLVLFFFVELPTFAE